MGSCGIRALLLVAKLLVLLYFAPSLDQSTVTQETHMHQTQALILVSGKLYARDGNPMWCWVEICHQTEQVTSKSRKPLALLHFCVD